MDELRNAFDDYAKLVENRLHAAATASDEDSPYLVHADENARVRGAAEASESAAQFQALIKAATESFAGEYHKASQLGHSWGWAEAVRTFFRRSGFYVDAYRSKLPNRDEVFRSFHAAFRRRTAPVRYLAPLELVYFHDNVFDCGGFTIRKFTAEGLRKALQLEAVAPCVKEITVGDLHLLSNYWYIDVTEGLPVRPLGTIHVDWKDEIVPRFTRLSTAVERCIKQLALFDWQPDWMLQSNTGRWMAPSIPFVISVDDNLLSQAHLGFDTSVLSMEERADEDGEVHEVPLIAFHLDEKETLVFEKAMSLLGEHVARIDGIDKWPFLNIACSYLAKGFFSEKTEQLLAHITSIEASLGQKGAGVNKRLRRRLAAVLGCTAAERKSIGERFVELYRIRNDLVHGNEIAPKVLDSHLNQARGFARRAAMWWIGCLAHLIHTSAAAHRSQQLRADVLAIVDAGSKTTKRRSNVLASLPPSFPSVPRWGQ